jgi:hypothetical protein
MWRCGNLRLVWGWEVQKYLFGSGLECTGGYGGLNEIHGIVEVGAGDGWIWLDWAYTWECLWVDVCTMQCVCMGIASADLYLGIKA